GNQDAVLLDQLNAKLAQISNILAGKSSLAEISPNNRWQVRTDILMIQTELNKLERLLLSTLSAQKLAILQTSRDQLKGTIEYAPPWILLSIACALGIGTMVGWKRIVVTVGEKIGKTHLTYSQGASAEIVAASTIGLADVLGMPVSTTHVL